MESGITSAHKTSEETVASDGNWLSAIRNEAHKVISQTVSTELIKNREELRELQDHHRIIHRISVESSIFDIVRPELEETNKEIILVKKDNSELRDIVNSHVNTISIIDKEARANNIEY